MKSAQTQFALCLLLLLAGCATLKQCAYEGVNRDQWQHPDRVIAALKIAPGARVTDLGAGSGYFTFRLAHAVGAEGVVYAVDVDQDMIALVQAKATEQNAGNIRTVQAKSDDPQLPENVDLVFTSNTYHHIDGRVVYFKNLQRHLRPGARVAIIDFDRRAAWLDRLWTHYTPSSFIKSDMQQAGYLLAQEFDFLDRQSFLIFTPLAQAPRAGRADSPPRAAPAS